MNGLDEIYYSNFCQHSKQVINYIAKNSLTSTLSCICIDKRKRNNQNHIIITLENGKELLLPPSICDVPSLLCKSKNYTLISGSNSILEHFNNVYGNIIQSTIVKQNGEPIALSSMGNNNNNNNIYSDYNLDQGINTPADTYIPNKVPTNVTNEMLQKDREMNWFPTPS